MRYTLDQLGDLFASKLRKEGASLGEHSVIFNGRIWRVNFTGLGATVIMAQAKKKGKANEASAAVRHD